MITPQSLYLAAFSTSVSRKFLAYIVRALFSFSSVEPTYPPPTEQSFRLILTAWMHCSWVPSKPRFMHVASGYSSLLPVSSLSRFACFYFRIASKAYSPVLPTTRASYTVEKCFASVNKSVLQTNMKINFGKELYTARRLVVHSVGESRRETSLRFYHSKNSKWSWSLYTAFKFHSFRRTGIYALHFKE